MKSEEREQLLLDVAQVEWWDKMSLDINRSGLLDHAVRLADFTRKQLSAAEGDDEILVSEEWLRAVGVLMADDDDSLGMPFSPGRGAECAFGVVRYVECWQAILSEGDTPDQIYLGDVKTRGDVRRLCTALGVPLKEVRDGV